MPRLVRSEFKGAWYHVMASGNRQEAIVEDAEDCESMLEVLGEVCERTGWQVHAWVLMGNHYHFVLHTPEANMVARRIICARSSLPDARADEWKAESSSGREPEERRPSTGWYLGGEDFRDWLLDWIEERMVGKSNSYSSSEQAHEHGEQRAQELLEAGFRFFDWTSNDLEALKGGDVRRLLIAELVRGRTSVNQQWIAENLKLKSAGNVSQQLRRLRKDLRDSVDAKLRRKWERFVKNV